MAPRKSIKGKKAPRWTPAEVDRLRELVAKEGTIAGGVRAFASETGRGESTVMNKWYKLQHAPSGLSAAPTPDSLASLSTDDLVALHAASKAEIGRRIEALRGAASDA